MRKIEFPHPVVFGAKGYPLKEERKKSFPSLGSPEEKIVIIEKKDRIDVWIPEFGKIHLLRDEKMNELVKNLRKAREEAEDFSRKMLSEYKRYV